MAITFIKRSPAAIFDVRTHLGNRIRARGRRVVAPSVADVVHQSANTCRRATNRTRASRNPSACSCAGSSNTKLNEARRRGKKKNVLLNNFSAVSVELIDELREALGSIRLDSKLRSEISEIADTLQGNLDKVVQHGKRADAIVKNMLLHSRQGSGEHRPVDINALVDESLNLAYHGARAEKQGFNISLEKSFDPAAGEVDLFPQEITRALLNLISNGFYAATKRKAEANGGDYEPTLAAATKNLGDSVEIRIRDNGTGIPPEVREKLFNPFFTTKPAGEGTGLGLSISHDIIVKQHGGSIEVDTEPGEFTEFRIVLPRAAAFASKSGDRA